MTKVTYTAIFERIEVFLMPYTLGKAATEHILALIPLTCQIPRQDHCILLPECVLNL